MTSGSGTFSTLEILINVSSEMLTRPRSTSLTVLGTQVGFFRQLS